MTIYEQAAEAAKHAKWPELLGHAQTLSQSPDWRHQSLARHIRDAWSLHLAEVRQADPVHRAKSDMVDAWKAHRQAHALETNEPDGLPVVAAIAVLSAAGTLGMLIGWMFQSGWIGGN